MKVFLTIVTNIYLVRYLNILACSFETCSPSFEASVKADSFVCLSKRYLPLKFTRLTSMREPDRMNIEKLGDSWLSSNTPLIYCAAFGASFLPKNLAEKPVWYEAHYGRACFTEDGDMRYFAVRDNQVVEVRAHHAMLGLVL